MGCVQSRTVGADDDDEELDFMMHGGGMTPTVILESASWAPGETICLQQGPDGVKRWPTATIHTRESANTGSSNKKPAANAPAPVMPANPATIDIGTYDVPMLSKLLQSCQTDSTDTPLAPQGPMPFMAPPSVARECAAKASIKSITSRVIVTSPFDSSVKFRVEDPAYMVFGLEAFSRGSEMITSDDTIWPVKRELMKNYKSVKSLDQHALKAADALRMSKPQQIVSYLTKPAKTDFQKFRVIFRWVAHAIAFENAGCSLGQKPDNSPLAVLRAGRADCCGHANLVKFLSSEAGLTCEVVVGYNKNVQPGKAPSVHAWNRIRLNNKWYLADCASASHKSASSCCPDKYREYEFMGELRYFNSRHLPMPFNRYGERVPYASVQQFNCQPTYGALASVCELQVLSHTMGVIRADKDNRVQIDMKSSLPMMTWTSLTTSTDFTDYREHAVQWWHGDVLHNDIYLPRPGTWEFKIFGQLVCDRGKERNPDALVPPTVVDTGHCHLITFTIIAQGNKSNLPWIAHDSGMCGMSITCKIVRPLSHVSPFVDADENGKAVIAFMAPDYRIKMVYRFFNVETHHRFIAKQVYMERVGDRVIAHVFCPAPGRYVIRLLINTSGKEYSRQGEYLINDTSSGKEERSMRFSQTMGYHVWGPNENFATFDLKISSGQSSSTIVAIDGEVHLQISWPSSRDLSLSCCLQDVQKEDRLQARRVLIYTTSDSDDSLSFTNFQIRMKETGFFVMQVYARTKDSAKHLRIGGWLIVVNKKSTKPRFPVEGLVCGPNDVFFKLGMRTTSPSKLETTNGKGCIDITYDSECEKTFRYEVTSANHDRYEDVIKVTSSAIKHDSIYVTSFNFALPAPNVYAIRLMAVGEGSEWNTIGTWIVIFDLPTCSSSYVQVRC